MKLYKLILTTAVMLIMFGIDQTNAQEGGWTRVSSTMETDTLYLAQGDAPQGDYFVRTKFKGNGITSSVVWTKGSLGNIPFQEILKLDTKTHVFQTGMVTKFQVLLHHNDTTISSAFANSSVGPWYTQSRSSWSGTLSVFDSLSIVETYHPLTTVFVEQTTDFDNFRVTLDGQDYLFYDGGEWASVSGTVWFDQNQNSIRDQGEKPLRGLKVYLGNSWLDSSYTDSAGSYQFQRRERGPHIIKPEPREFWTVTTHASGESTLVIANNPLYYTDVNFGLYSDLATVYAVNPGWNIISVPKTGSNMAKTNLYPSAVSQAFSYNNGYTGKDTLETSKGYWMKFADTEVVLAGNEFLQDTIEVVPGWNMIGALSQPLAINSITSEPSGLQMSQFWGYAGRYYETDTLKPNQGYWVKVIGEGGQLILNAATVKFAKATGQNIVIVHLNELPPPAPGMANSEWPMANSQLPTKFALEQNYPNPFNPVTVIAYAIPNHEAGIMNHELVTLKVFNILGQEVATLVNEVKTAGKYTVSFNGSNLPSGMYFYRLQTNAYCETKKMLLLK